jgi:hypothetical protein
VRKCTRLGAGKEKDPFSPVRKAGYRPEKLSPKKAEPFGDSFLILVIRSDEELAIRGEE